jgi:signal peptide peptidase SppA
MENTENPIVAAIAPVLTERCLLLSESHAQAMYARIAQATREMRVPIEQPESQGQVAAPGVAIIPIVGILTKYATPFDQWMGWCPTMLLMQYLSQSLNDASIEQIVLVIDSPGGFVNGTVEFADAVAKANEVKPVTAIVTGLCCSGAYYIASQAGQIIARRECEVGNIGVYAVLADRTKMLEAMGISLTLIASKRFKGMGADGKVTDDLKADTARINDDLFQQFVTAVATGRGMDPARAMELSDGRAFLGPQAKQLGLIDDVTSSVDETLQAITTRATSPNQEKNMAKATASMATAVALATPVVTPRRADDDTESSNTAARKVLQGTIASATDHKGKVRAAMDHAGDMADDADDDTKALAKRAVSALKSASDESARCIKAWKGKVGDTDDDDDDEDKPTDTGGGDGDEAKKGQNAEAYVAAFGDVGGRWFVEGKPFHTAAAEFITKLQADHKAATDVLKSENAELKKKLSAIDRGNPEAIASVPEGTKTGASAKPTKQGLTPNLALAAAAMKLPGKN